MPTNESTVPIRILYNIAAPYNGPARTVGGVVIGYLGKYYNSKDAYIEQSSHQKNQKYFE